MFSSLRKRWVFTFLLASASLQYSTFICFNGLAIVLPYPELPTWEINKDTSFSIGENVYCSHPFMTERMKQKLTSFMVSAMMAFLGSASPALLASDTASPKDLKQGSGVNSTTCINWCTLVTSKPCSRYHLRRVVANKIFSPFILPIKLRRGWAMMLCSSALVCMKSSISSRLFSVFLKMGHISLNFSFKCWGTRIFTSTHPNKRPFRTSIKIRPGLIILIVSKVLRTSVAIKRCSSWVVLFICRH